MSETYAIEDREEYSGIEASPNADYKVEVGNI